jgi:hypothetical protein
MAGSGIHVVRDGNVWWVLREGETCAPAPPFSRARDAIRTGRSLARAARSEFTLYDESGRVRAWKDFDEASGP